MSPAVMTLPGLAVPVWQVRGRSDPAARALADRRHSRKRPGALWIGPPGRVLVLVTPCERAVWLTHWPRADLAFDGLDAWRCSLFRNEGAGRSSDLIRAAMTLTAQTWVEPAKVASPHPGYCFKQAGWTLDRAWSHRRLVRLRAPILETEGRPLGTVEACQAADAAGQVGA